MPSAEGVVAGYTISSDTVEPKQVVSDLFGLTPLPPACSPRYFLS